MVATDGMHFIGIASKQKRRFVSLTIGSSHQHLSKTGSGYPILIPFPQMVREFSVRCVKFPKWVGKYKLLSPTSVHLV